jgi:hypothetical protein
MKTPRGRGKERNQTPEDAISAYVEALPKHCGDLHERMKYLMEIQQALSNYANDGQDKHLQGLSEMLAGATADLEHEVAYTAPARPPFGSRTHMPRRDGMPYQPAAVAWPAKATLAMDLHTLSLVPVPV